MLDKIRDGLALWRSELDKLEAELESKLQRLTYLQEAPLPPPEIAEFVIAAMNERSDHEFHRHFVEKLAPAVNNPLLESPNPEWRPGIMGNITNPNRLDPWCLFHLLREPLTRAIKSEIESFQGFPEAGPPRAERQAEILKLERDVEKLRERIEAERQAARGAGVELSALHQRDRIPTRPRDLK